MRAVSAITLSAVAVSASSKVPPFTKGKFKTAGLPELRIKDGQVPEEHQLPTYTMEEFLTAYSEEELTFDKPFMVKGAGPHFFTEWEDMLNQTTVDFLKNDPYFSKKVRIDYYSALEAQLIREGREDPKSPIIPRKYTLGRFFSTCFIGDKGRPREADNATQDCEFTTSAKHLRPLDFDTKLAMTWPGNRSKQLIDNLNRDWQGFLNAAIFRPEMMAEIEEEVVMLLRKKALMFMMEQIDSEYQHLVMGPSGSGGRMETGYGHAVADVLLKGSRRWTLVSEEEVNIAAGDDSTMDLNYLFDSAWGFYTRGWTNFQTNFQRYYEVQQEEGDAVFVPLRWAKLAMNTEDSVSIQEKFISGEDGVAEVRMRNIWGPDFETYDTWNVAFCHDTMDYDGNVPTLGSQDRDQWFLKEMGQANPHEFYKPTLTVLLNCAKMHHARDKIAGFMDFKHTLCDNQRYEKCRKMLVSKIEAQREVAGKVKLNWLPERLSYTKEELEAMETKKRREESLDDDDDFDFHDKELEELDDDEM